MSDLSSITENTQKNLDQDARLDAAEAKNLEQDGRLDATEAVANASTQKNIEQDNRLDATETVANAAEIKNTEQDTRLDANDQKNLEQDNRLTDTEAVADAAALKNLEQDGRLDANDTKNTEQDTRLTDIETDIQNIETKNTQQDTRLDNIETKNTEQDGRLTDTEAVANAAQTVADAAALKNNEQDGRLDLIEDKNTEQDTRLTDTETVADAAIPLAQKGVINGVAQLDGTGKIPINQIPSLAKSSKVVADITARDAILAEDRFEGLRVHVLDASADPSVTTGSAGYILKSVLTNSDWEKAYESESLDLDIDANIDTHLNTSSASANQILSWNGTDYAWVDDQTGGGTSYTDADVDTHLNKSNALDGQILSYDLDLDDYVWVTDQTGGAGYTDADVDTHLNTSTANANQILSWNGSDYAWVNDQTGGGGGGSGAPVYNLLYDDEIFYDTGDETYFPFISQTFQPGGLLPAFGSTNEFINSSTKALGQRFTFKNTKTITSVDFPIVQMNSGDPKGTIVMEIKEVVGTAVGTLLASESFDAATTLAPSGTNISTILNVPISGGVTLSPGTYIVSLRFETYTSGILFLRSSTVGLTDQNPPYINDNEVGSNGANQGSYVSSTNSGNNFTAYTNKNLCFRLSVDKDPVTGFVPQIQFFEDIILQTPGLPNTANVIPVSESPILMPNNGDIAYVIPNTSAPGGNLTVTVVNGPENVPTNARIIATKIQESETLMDSLTDSGFGTSTITTDKKNIIMIENQAIRATIPRLHYFNASSTISRAGHTKGISMPIKLRLFNNTIS